MGTPSTAEAETPAETTVIWMNPGDLLTDRNIRGIVLDEEFLESVGELGILEPVVALRTADDRTRVWLGHRRVAAADRTGKQVPVWVIGDETDNRAMRRMRLLGQFDENKHRRSLTGGEEAAVVEALFELKMTAAAIAKRMNLDPAQVAAARKVAKSEFATKAADQHNLNLLQSGVVAEFSEAGDGEAATALIAAADDNPRQFDHLAQRLRDSAADRAKRRAIAAELQAAGITVVASQYQNMLGKLRTADGGEITAEDHASCPGHAAYISHDLERIDPPPESGSQYHEVLTVTYVCTDPDQHGHTRPPERTQPDKTEEERAADLAKGRAVREGNKAWKSAAKVRWDFLVSFAAQKSAPKDAAAFMAAYISGSGNALRQSMERGHPFACDLFGLAKPDDASYYSDERKKRLAAYRAAASPARQILIGLVILLAACEKQCASVDTWRREDNQYWTLRGDAAMYLLYLETQGHVLSEAEESVARPAPAGEPDSDDTEGDTGDVVA